MKKKVLIIDNYPAPYRVKLYNLINEKFNLTVVYGTQQDKTRDNKYCNSDYKYEVKFFKGIKIGTRSNLSFKIIKLLKENKYDCILCPCYDSPMIMLAIRYMKRHKIPFILSADGGFMRVGENKYKYKLKKYLISSAAMWMTTGKSSLEWLCYYGAIRDKVYLFPFAFDEQFNKYLPTAQEKLDIKKKLNMNKKISILYVGRMIKVKNVDILLNAYSKIQGDVSLYFVGDTLTEEYNRLVQTLGLENIHCVGFKSGKDLIDYYLACDMLVLPTDGEVWGLVINEAMRFGCPVITTTKCNAGLEMIDNNVNGIMVEPYDIEALANAIEELINNEKQREKFSALSYEKIKNFTIENNAAIHCDTISKFIENYIE